MHFEAQSKSQLKVFTSLWKKQVVKKNNEIQRKSAQKIAFSRKMMKMHLRPYCIQPTKYGVRKIITVLCEL